MFKSSKIKEATTKVQNWKASVNKHLSDNEKSLTISLPNLQAKIENHQRIDLKLIEDILLAKLRVKFYTKLQEKITYVFNNLKPMFEAKTLSPEDAEALYYLRCVQLSDSLEISQKAIESLKSLKGEKPQVDREAQIALSRVNHNTKMSVDEIIEYATELAQEVGDNENVIFNILATKREYKQKITEHIQQQEEQRRQKALEEQQRKQQDAYWAQQGQQIMQINQQPQQNVSYGIPSPVNSNPLSDTTPSPIPTPPPSAGAYQFQMGIGQPSYPSTDDFQPLTVLPQNPTQPAQPPIKETISTLPTDIITDNTQMKPSIPPPNIDSSSDDEKEKSSSDNESDSFSNPNNVPESLKSSGMFSSTHPTTVDKISSQDLSKVPPPLSSGVPIMPQGQDLAPIMPQGPDLAPIMPQGQDFAPIMPPPPMDISEQPFDPADISQDSSLFVSVVANQSSKDNN